MDPVALAGLVEREVRTGTRGGGATRIAVARRTYATDPTDLWDCLTNADRLPRWFLPVSGELHVGGRYQLEGNAGGVVEVCDAPTTLAVTWEYGDTVSWLTVTLQPAGDGTRLELVHEAPVDPDFWAEFGPGAVGVGWDLALVGLGWHIDGGDPGAAIDPELRATFDTSPDGVALVTAAARAWGEAAIADGDDAAAAREAAERTVAFYTTVPEG
jgi:uncharacterized protein YndB with AHSA1/START domain